MDRVVEQLARFASPSPAVAGASTSSSGSGGGAASGRSSVAAAARTGVSAQCVGLDESRAVIGSSVLGSGSFADVRSGTYRFPGQVSGHGQASDVLSSCSKCAKRMHQNRFPGQGQASDVAFKIFRGGQQLSESMRASIEKEVAVGMRLKHPSLVCMLGVVDSVAHGPCIVLELCEGGSLRAVLDRPLRSA